MATHRAESVRKLQRGLYRAAKSNGARKFYSLYDKVCRPDVLWQAWEEVKANRGAPGVDGLSIEAIVASGEMAFVAELGRQLKERTYRPIPVRRVLIPKPKGGQRALGIPSLADRVVQTAARVVLEPIFEADFRDCSYGYRPRRGAREAEWGAHRSGRSLPSSRAARGYPGKSCRPQGRSAWRLCRLGRA